MEKSKDQDLAENVRSIFMGLRQAIKLARAAGLEVDMHIDRIEEELDNPELVTPALSPSIRIYRVL
jgi:hypothetical protein